MKLTNTAQAGFRRITDELIEWMDEHAHPHCTVIVTSGCAELKEDVLVNKPVKSDEEGG